ncbi:GGAGEPLAFSPDMLSLRF-amide [Caenorhabditis elegans]|uniref:FMRFamide-like neuropeptides 26 n=1 Tax=Caenorhabditis elegans TaxID=6239 RepID=FLP26_CAEEL|nr:GGAGEPLAFSPDMLSLRF-amide [Caenorhabditis elegans]Q8MPY9.1 RecName: Full=FMRFamide-like neuropeptides 26; Contains: RecName: Full=EFNADDLTLRF-amide; Contains: RecName: Full=GGAGEPLAFSPDMLSLRF-amide; Flags: Precursor [Caenorhabditis elegans]CCD61850.1 GGAGEPLAFSPDMLSLRF-amide [Caenorhabditis elegans]|eukprot:NP_741827.1 GGAGEPLAFSPDMLSLRF-amide [Caenorhabditis elegans]
MKVMFMLALLFSSLVATSAFRLPFQFFGANEDFNSGLTKRNYYESKPYKREFNADDLTLRFGKRGGAGEPLAFSPDMLSLRFGK